MFAFIRLIGWIDILIWYQDGVKFLKISHVAVAELDLYKLHAQLQFFFKNILKKKLLHAQAKFYMHWVKTLYFEHCYVGWQA